MLAEANKALKLNDDLSIEKNRNIIFVYCPPKVGSTSLVSSIRLFASTKFTVIHLHNEIMLYVLSKIQHVTINDIIKYNKSLGKNVYVIDIYRSPIEQKISYYFEEISSHFNNTETNINKINLDIITKRFNNIFPYIETVDYFKTIYGIQYDESFNFDKMYCLKEENGINYIKLRLKDSETHWQKILLELLQVNITIVKDYTTENKIIKELFIKFKQEYKIPSNLFDIIVNDNSLKFYYTEEERNEYISSWQSKVTSEYLSYTESEYKLYKTICYENNTEVILQKNHYMDLGCTCKLCSLKRATITNKINTGKPVTGKIIHNSVTPIHVFKKFKPKISRNIMGHFTKN